MDNQEIVLSPEVLSAAQAILAAKVVLMVQDTVRNYIPPRKGSLHIRFGQPDVGTAASKEYFDILGQLTGYKPDKIRAHFKKI